MGDLMNLYAHLFARPAGPGDMRPTAIQIIKDHKLIGAWKDRTVLVTGGSSGIGLETARAMHATGADVFITARAATKGDEAVSEIRKSSLGTGRLEVIEMELSSLASVRKAANSFLQQLSCLNILINNAGVMDVPHALTEDGHESHLAVNYLAHFLLTNLLLPKLLSSSTSQFLSRVVNVSSSSHRFAAPSFTDLNMTKDYDGQRAYGASKTAQIWHANHLDRLYGSQGVHALSIHPGGIYTGLTRHQTDEAMAAFENNVELNQQMKNVEQGAATTVFAAVSPALEGKGGVYLADCGPTEKTDVLDGPLHNGYAPWAFDEGYSRQLWDISLDLTRIQQV